MRALTLTQPWATLVAVGAKTVETRSWNTRYRGPLAIHAAKGLPPGGRNELRRICRQGPFARALEAWRPELGDAGSAANPLPLGAFVAVCNLDRTHRLVRQPASRLGTDGELYTPTQGFVPPEGEAKFGNYEPGRYAWVLTDVRPLADPVPYVGALGLRYLDREFAAELDRLAAQLVGV